MNRQAVSSSNISTIGWEGGVLEVEFQNGAVYQYSGVPQREYEQLLQASSIGKMLRERIAGRYTHKRMPQ